MVIGDTMAYATHRSWNKDMRAGATDGSFKKYAMNRGGVVEDTTAALRRLQSGVWHGFNETQTKVLPDGRVDQPPYYHDVTPQDKENV
jgi:hypothetical protein